MISNRSGASRRRNFFAELLPEGTALETLAAEIRVSSDEVIALLAQFGRDVAGVVQIYDPEAAGEPRTPALAPVDAVEGGRMLTNTQVAPLGNRPKSGRTSLAGVQDKIVLARQNDRWFQVLEGYPSTHIVKPSSVRFPTITFDEEYGFRAAKAAGLTELDAWIEDFGGIAGLLRIPRGVHSGSLRATYCSSLGTAAAGCRCRCTGRGPLPHINAPSHVGRRHRIVRIFANRCLRRSKGAPDSEAALPKSAWWCVGASRMSGEWRTRLD